MALRARPYKRRHERVGIVRNVALRLEGARKPYGARLIDLSEGGLRGVAALPEVAVGAHVTVDVQVPGWFGVRTLSLPAVIVRLGPPLATPAHREFAVEFRGKPEPVSRRLAAFMHTALRAHERVSAAQGTDSPLADSLRMVRVCLGPPKPDRARVVLVSSAAPGEGKSFTAAHLAALLASEGQRVLLVDADLRRPTLAQSFGVAPKPGLAEWLAQGAEPPVADFVQPTRAGLSLLAAGRGSHVTEGWSREDALALVERIRVGDWDFVVIDSPPLLVAAVSTLLAAAADDVLLVARAGLTRERELVEARRLLERHGANLRGVVLNDHVDSPQSDYADYYQAQRRSLRRLVRRSSPAIDDGSTYELPDGH
jgi:capsular exopolysaccharide synthesis family protein